MSGISGATSLMSMTSYPRSNAGHKSSSITAHVAAADVIGATPSSPASKTAEQILIDQIMEKGLMRWGQDQRMEELKAKLRAEALQGLGLSEDDLAKLEPELQAAIEDRIAQLIREKLEAALEEQQGAGPQVADQSTPGKSPTAKPTFIITV